MCVKERTSATARSGIRSSHTHTRSYHQAHTRAVQEHLGRSNDARGDEELDKLLTVRQVLQYVCTYIYNDKLLTVRQVLLVEDDAADARPT